MNDRDFKAVSRLRMSLRHVCKTMIFVDPHIMDNFNVTLRALFEDIERLDTYLADHFELSGQSGGGGD